MPKEAAWPIGFIAGAVLTSTLAGYLGLGGLGRFLCVIGGGVLVGVLADTLHRSGRRPQVGGSGRPLDPR